MLPGLMLPGLPNAKRVFPTAVRILAAAGALALAAVACQPAPPENRSDPPSTAPAAVSTATAAVAAPTPGMLPTGALPVRAGATGQPPLVSESPLASLEAPADVAARTDERMAELTGRILRPRPVETDLLWGALLAYRALGAGTGNLPDNDAPAKMLEMWHGGNACYITLEAEVQQLGEDNRLGPVEFNAYFDSILARVLPCLDEQWPEVDAETFFANTDAIRTDRVSTWFDSIWDRSKGEALASVDRCREGFYAHLPAVASAGESGDLQSAWGPAMVEFSECRQAALREEMPFVYLGDTQLFAFELNDRYTLIALQATVGGHLVAISMRRPYEDCWPDFEASIPEVALAAGPAQLAESRDAALRSLRACIESLPE